jgi:hypothetical protein
MPASIHNAARWFSRETFSIWNPQTGDFYGELIGRKKRIDAFVSLWHRSTRREHLYFLPEAEQQYDLTQAVVLRHDNSGTLYLISETIERDYWINDSQYVTMVRAHRVVPPSGGPAQFFPVRVQGSGDDLGPVVIGPAQACYADTELRSTHKTEDSEETSIGEYFVAYSRNIEEQEGDFISVGGVYYRFMELHSDSGYRYSRASQESPKFKTVEFKLPAAASPAIFDPVTGTMTSSDEVSRQVSVLVGDEIAAGRVAEHKVDESMTLFIYLNHIGFEPYLGQTVIRDGRKYRVISKNLRIEEKQIKLEVAP